MTTFEGGCACDEIRYRLRSAPMFVNCCHCRDCQRQTGSAFVINAIIETDRIELVVGEPEAVAVPTDSGRAHDIYRCPTCAVAVWSDYGRRRALRFVRVGTLDQPQALPPNAHIFTRTKLPWVNVDGAPAFESSYEMETQWPAESLARRRAILGIEKPR
jgi:hypothetical protein